MRRLLSAALATAVALALALPAAAQPDPKAEALRLGHAALERFRAGEHAAALADFEAAEAAVHSPVFVLYIARCERALGRLRVALASYDRVLAESLTASAPRPWRAAVDEARTERAALAARIPRLTVVLPGSWPDGAVLTVDGEPAAAGEPVALDPGVRQVVVRQGDVALATREVTLVEGAAERVTLEPPEPGPALLPSPEPPSPAPEPPVRPPPVPFAEPVLVPAPAPLPPEGPSARLVGGAVTLGVGGVGLLVGVGTGVAALARADQAKDGCVDNLCPAENASHKAAADDIAHVATAAFAIGGVAAGVGLVLVLLEATAPAAPVGERGTVFLTPSGLGLRF